MRTVYLDESEQSAAGIFAVAGYVFDPRSVRDFDRRWREILGMWKVPEFHMKEFAYRKNAFAGWSDGSRRAFLDRLIQTIHDHAQFHVMVSVDTDALSTLTPNEKLEMLD